MFIHPGRTKLIASDNLLTRWMNRIQRELRYLSLRGSKKMIFQMMMMLLRLLSSGHSRNKKRSAIIVIRSKIFFIILIIGKIIFCITKIWEVSKTCNIWFYICRKTGSNFLVGNFEDEQHRDIVTKSRFEPEKLHEPFKARLSIPETMTPPEKEYMPPQETMFIGGQRRGAKPNKKKSGKEKPDLDTAESTKKETLADLVSKLFVKNRKVSRFLLYETRDIHRYYYLEIILMKQFF